MGAILILLIISIQFAIGYFAAKYLTLLNNKIIEINNKIEEITPNIQPNFEKARETFQKINKVFVQFFQHKNKIVVYKNLMLLKTIIVTIILIKKRKSILNFFSLYDVISKTTKAIMEL